MVALEPHQQFLVLVSLTQAVAAVEHTTAERLELAVLVAAVQAETTPHPAQERQAQPTQAAEAERVAHPQMLLQLLAQVDRASSSFPTLWRPALRSSLSPQQRGLRRLVRRRWITLS